MPNLTDTSVIIGLGFIFCCLCMLISVFAGLFGNYYVNYKDKVCEENDSLQECDDCEMNNNNEQCYNPPPSEFLNIDEKLSEDNLYFEHDILPNSYYPSGGVIKVSCPKPYECTNDQIKCIQPTPTTKTKDTIQKSVSIDNPSYPNYKYDITPGSYFPEGRTIEFSCPQCPTPTSANKDIIENSISENSSEYPYYTYDIPKDSYFPKGRTIKLRCPTIPDDTCELPTPTHRGRDVLTVKADSDNYPYYTHEIPFGTYYPYGRQVIINCPSLNVQKNVTTEKTIGLGDDYEFNINAGSYFPNRETIKITSDKSKLKNPPTISQSPYPIPPGGNHGLNIPSGTYFEYDKVYNFKCNKGSSSSNSYVNDAN